MLSRAFLSCISFYQQAGSSHPNTWAFRCPTLCSNGGLAASSLPTGIKKFTMHTGHCCFIIIVIIVFSDSQYAVETTLCLATFRFHSAL
jgi:hypothetical protein